MARTKLSPRRLQAIRQQLIDRITELYRSVHQDARDSMQSPMIPHDEPQDEGDESVLVQLRDQRLLLAEGEARRAQLMEAALHRIARGEYGECIDCGEAIDVGRLELVPWASRCIYCQEEEEQERRQHPPSL